MAINMKQKKRKYRYVRRWDFSLPETDNDNSEIGKEVRRHIVFYKVGWLLIGGSAWAMYFLMLIALWICHANLIYIKILGILLFLLALMYVEVLKIPKITGSDIKKLEDELNMKSDSWEEFNAIFTENAVIFQHGILVYRIPYLEIVRIKLHSYRGTVVARYRLCNGSHVLVAHHGGFVLRSFDPLYERLLKYNSNIIISIDGKRKMFQEKGEM